MSKYENSIISLCLSYIIYVFLYGIVIKFTVSNSILFQLKTYIPELFLVLIILISILRNGLRLKSFSVPLLGYSAIVFLFNLIICGFNEQTLYWIRDLYIPLVAFSFLLIDRFSEKGMNLFVKRLIVFFKLYLILGFILALVQQINGWEGASSFYTGYVFYEQDPVSKIKIAHNMGLLRAPSLSGNFAIFGYYCLISVVFIDAKSNKLWEKLFWNILALSCMVLATNKSAIVAFAVMFVLEQTVDLRNKSKKLNNTLLVLILGSLGVTTIMLFGDNSSGQNILTSLFARFEVWKGIFANTSFFETLFPYKQFMYGSGVEGGISFFDKTYLYCLITQGILGTVLWVYVLSKVYKKSMGNDNLMTRHYIYGLTICLLVLGLTVIVTQGGGFFSHYLILLATGFSIAGGGICKIIQFILQKSLHNSFEWRCTV